MKRYAAKTFGVFVLLMLCTLLMSLPGCNGSTSATRLSTLNRTIEFYRAQASNQAQAISVFEKTLSDLKVVLEQAQETGDDQLIAKATAAVGEVESALAKAKDVKALADQVIDATGDKIDSILAGTDEVTFADEVEAYIPAAQAAAAYLPPPWNLIINAGLAGLAGLAGYKKHTSDTALTQVVAGVHSVLKRQTPSEAETTKRLLEAKQTPATEAKVKTVLVKKVLPADPTVVDHPV